MEYNIFNTDIRRFPNWQYTMEHFGILHPILWYHGNYWMVTTLLCPIIFLQAWNVIGHSTRPQNRIGQDAGNHSKPWNRETSIDPGSDFTGPGFRKPGPGSSHDSSYVDFLYCAIVLLHNSALHFEIYLSEIFGDMSW